jgi:hypothetical protein
MIVTINDSHSGKCPATTAELPSYWFLVLYSGDYASLSPIDNRPSFATTFGDGIVMKSGPAGLDDWVPR